MSGVYAAPPPVSACTADAPCGTCAACVKRKAAELLGTRSSSSLRAFEPGWIRIGRYESSRRRSIWARRTEEGFELCAGREGDDDYAVVRYGDPVCEIISAQVYAQECMPPLDPQQKEHVRAEARAAAAERELERWRHGAPVEGDFVCPNELAALTAKAERDEARDMLRRMLWGLLTAEDEAPFEEAVNLVCRWAKGEP